MSTDRIPTEFRYWENLDRSRARRLRAASRALLGFDPAPPDDTVRTIASMYFDADPLAEAFVEETYLARGSAYGRGLLDAALAKGVSAVPDAPASLVRLFEDIETPPAWVNPALVERGARVFRRYGPDVFEFAGAITLAAYSESSVAKPLSLTGAYAGSSTKHRFLETAAFWIAVSEPGGLAPFAPGRASALRVRVMHVFVRKRLMEHPEWDLAAWGVPISQGDALLTLMGGSVAPGFGMQLMGYRPSFADIEAMMHFWRWVGHLMGVRPRWFPSSLREAMSLAFVADTKAARLAGDDGKRLCRSYLDAFTPDPGLPLASRVRAAWDNRMHRGFTRFFLPTAAYRANELPSAWPWALHPLARFPLLFGAETLRRALPPLDDVADRVARARRDRWFAHHMGGRTAEYRPAESFTR